MSGTSSPQTESEGVVVVEFDLSDSVYPFIGVSREEDCSVALEKILPRASDRYAEFFSITGADPDDVLALTEDRDVVDSRVVTRSEDGGLVEFVVSGFCPAQNLAEFGAIPQEVECHGGDGRIVAEIPASADAAGIVDEFLDSHPGAELVAKHTRDRPTPMFIGQELERAVDERLTDRQKEVLLAAYEASYYDAGSETTGADLADQLGITPPTLSQHLAAAERKLVSIIIEDNLV